MTTSCDRRVARVLHRRHERAAQLVSSFLARTRSVIAAARIRTTANPCGASQCTRSHRRVGRASSAGDGCGFPVSCLSDAGTCHVRTPLGGGGNPEMRNPERDDGGCELWWRMAMACTLFADSSSHGPHRPTRHDHEMDGGPTAKRASQTSFPGGCAGFFSRRSLPCRRDHGAHQNRSRILFLALPGAWRESAQGRRRVRRCRRDG